MNIKKFQLKKAIDIFKLADWARVYGFSFLVLLNSKMRK